jgi:hypothetical protein
MPFRRKWPYQVVLGLVSGRTAWGALASTATLGDLFATAA